MTDYYDTVREEAQLVMIFMVEKLMMEEIKLSSV